MHLLQTAYYSQSVATDNICRISNTNSISNGLALLMSAVSFQPTLQLAPCRYSLSRPLTKVAALCNSDVLLSVCLFVCLLSVKYVKSFATCQHLGASGAYRVDPYTLVSLSCLAVF